MDKKIKSGVVNNYQLALLSDSVFDVGPRLRFLILLFGFIGIALAFVKSLVSGQNVPLDKIIHFSGYFVLTVTFFFALRPRFFLLGMIGLICVGVGIEFLQKHTGRSFDPKDMIANTTGVVVGGLVGLTIRGIYAFIRKEIAARRVRSSLYSFPANEVLIHEGDPVPDLFIIKEGCVSASRKVNGKEVILGTLKAGDVLGLLGVIEEKPQYATLTTKEATTLYRMSLDELMESSGGKELPVSLVLNGLCKKIRILVDQNECLDQKKLDPLLKS